jgi:hypothetical protein
VGYRSPLSEVFSASQLLGLPQVRTHIEAPDTGAHGTAQVLYIR